MQTPVFNQLIKFVKKRYGQILLAVILLTIIGLSIKWGYYLLSNDNYSPELNPRLSISRYLESPAWRSYRTVGFASDSEQADIFRSIFFFLLKPILPGWILGQLFYFVCLFVGSWFTALLVSSFVKESKVKKYTQLAFLFSGFIYISTLWTMWLYYQDMSPYISNFGFLPLLLWSIYRYVRTPNTKRALILVISSIFFTSTSVISTLFLVDLVLITVFTFFVVLIVRKERGASIRRALRAIMLLLLTQLFWILPFIYYTFTTSQDIVDSYTNRTITTSTIDLETEMQNALNSARLYNRNLFEVEDEQYIFPLAEEFQTYDFYKVAGVLPAFFSVLALIFGVIRSNKKLLFWGVIAIGSWFLIKVINPPFENIFIWMQENIPLFKQVFRWPFSKLGQIYLISISLLSAFGIVYLVSFLSSFIRRRKIRRIFVILLSIFLFILPLAYSEYLFRGYIFPQRALVEIPNDYYELKDYLVNNKLDGRIYYAPPANNNYFREYDWGFWGSQFISYIIPNPMMDMSSAIGSVHGEKALLELNNVVRVGDANTFNLLMHRYDIEYVLLDESLEYEGYSFDIEGGKLQKLFAQYEKLWESDTLKLYKVPSKKVEYVESLSSLSNIEKDTFVRDISRNPLLSPTDIEVGNIEIRNNEIVGEFEYTGNSTYISSNINPDLLGTYPAYLLLQNGQVRSTPSFPYLVGDTSTRPYKLFTGGNFDYYILGTQVFSSTLLEEGITVSDKYSSLNSIYGVSDSDFKSVNLIPRFADSPGSDCSGGHAVNDTSVFGEERTTGFNLKGASDLPCAYTRIHSLDINSGYVVKVKLNWETEPGNYPGYCLYSETQERCLNSDKFFDTQGSFGEQEVTVETVVYGSEKLSLILYTMNTNKQFSSETTFREVTLKYAPILNKLDMVDTSDIWKKEDIFLDGGNIYEVSIPLIFGNSSYIYQKENSNGHIWQPNKPDSGNTLFEISASSGMYQKTQNDYIDQISNLFVTKPSTKYLLYWNGENISNIPADICLIYDKEEKCWLVDMFADSVQASYRNFFVSDSESKLLNIIYGSSSYKLLTENRLDDFVVMEYPQIWSNVEYVQSSIREYDEMEMFRTFDSVNSTYYKLRPEKESLSNKNVLASIPQASNDGWIAVGRKGLNFEVLSENRRVSINGWKQGWDISNTSYDSISVIYWPNLLSYFGYLVIAGEISYLTYKLIRNRRYAKR